ncbi:MAG TPA: SDR family oxidoreductase [Frankiaceae bacterium]|jgi:NAD(P)-dependent dehydrogenase (short-subunit alcohol dehydrogenase family)|nr:SDR family oxidoreductase [Frankiaceae bacterium]
MTEAARIALVTGGSRGIGARTAVTLASQGWDVAISYRVRADVAQDVVDSCRQLGRRALAVQADVASESDIVRLFAAVDRELGPLWGLVNNAGVVPPGAAVEEYTAARLQDLFAVNVTGAFLAAGEAVRRMSSVGGGSGGVIVNVSSRAAALGGAGEYVDYAASKAAIDAMTIGLAREVAAEGIRVVGVSPGLISTDIHAPGRLDRLGASPPLGRPGDPQEVANAIAWLISDEASYVTGATLDISGGR